MAASGGQDQVPSHLEEKAPEKQGLFERVKDSLNVTKHLGFISDVDSPANQAALAAVREREEREGVTEEVPQAPLSERVWQGMSEVADTASAAATGVSGGVAPKGQGAPDEAESVKELIPGNTLARPEADLSGTGDKGQDVSNGPTPKDSKHQHRVGHKGQDSQAGEKEGHSFSTWAARTANKLGHVVASKDLTDDPSSKKNNKK